MTRIMIVLAALACSGCAGLYSAGNSPATGQWRTVYVSFLWQKDFSKVDLARGRAESMKSSPDADATKAVAAGIVEGLK